MLSCDIIEPMFYTFLVRFDVHVFLLNVANRMHFCLFIKHTGWPRKHLTPVPQAGKVLIFICEIPVKMKFSGHFNHAFMCQKFWSISIKSK